MVLGLFGAAATRLYAPSAFAMVRPRRAMAPAAGQDDDESALGWLHEASRGVRTVSDQVAEEVDRTSERVIRGLRSFTDRALKKYRETFQKDKKPPQE